MTDRVNELAAVSLRKPVKIFVDSNKTVAWNLQQEFVRVRPNQEAHQVGRCDQKFYTFFSRRHQFKIRDKYFYFSLVLDVLKKYKSSILDFFSQHDSS